ncbi:MAG: phosphoglucosamine mutase [Actinomycetota bacterium]|nr:phosphoglucosamine mutase [Actinomycetota bacterium]
MARLFGTDGIRGLAGGDVLTADLAEQVAAAAAAVLIADRAARPVVVIGRDTRPSGPMLEAASIAGFTAAGCDVVRLGVVPTPVVAFEVQRGAALGLMISASHNPAPDNGLKLFATGGGKLTDAQEDAIEARLGEVRPATTAGRVSDASASAYADHLLDSVGSLAGLHVVVDGAEGAASTIAPDVYRRAGATVTAIHCEADGAHINDGCGATHPESLAAAVVQHGADIGIAHDGDADRCIVVDATGAVLNGDQVLGLLALARKDAELPASDVLVATVMSNLGLVQAMSAADIEVVQTAVGDRYVLEAMLAGGYRLGGEQSGHVVMLDHASTGDGSLTALQVMDRVVRTGRTVAELAAAVTLLPQVLVNVAAPRERAVAPDVLAEVAAQETALNGAGRVLLRPSGTEPLVRVMVEAPTQDEAERVAQHLAAVVSR